MHPITIAFLLGLNPSPHYNYQIQNQWDALTVEQQSVLVRQFESEYQVRIKELTVTDLNEMKRDLQLRTWDLQSRKK